MSSKSVTSPTAQMESQYSYDQDLDDILLESKYFNKRGSSLLTRRSSGQTANVPSSSMLLNLVVNKLNISTKERKLSRTSSDSEEKPAANLYCRYKTELCRPFREHGECKYGNKCQYAHGASELRSALRHPKYKTELCRKYHSTGFCNYGPRCNFIHNEEEDEDLNTKVASMSPFSVEPSSSPSSFGSISPIPFAGNSAFYSLSPISLASSSSTDSSYSEDLRTNTPSPSPSLEGKPYSNTFGANSYFSFLNPSNELMT